MVPNNADEHDPLESLLNRRQVLRGGAALGISAGLASLLAACGGTSSSTSTGSSSSSSSGGTLSDQLVVNLADEPPTWNTLDNNIQYLRWVTDQVQETLYGFDDELRTIPILADGMPVQNGRTATIRIRRGITFQNGDPLTAEHVAATFNAARGQGRIWAGALSSLVRAEAVDDLTTRFTFKPPYTGLVDRASIIPIMHRDFLRVSNKAMGTGPYQWDSYVRGSQVTLRAWDRYRDGAPKTARILFQIVPDSATQLVNLLRGDCDILPMPAYAQVPSLRKNKKVTVYDVQAPVDIFFWLSERMIPDVRVRQAIAYAMDRRRVVEIAYNGLADPGEGPIPPSADGYRYAERLFSAEPDYDRARALLREAGVDSFRFIYISTVEPQQKAMAQVLQQSWAEVGLVADLQLSTYAAWQSAWTTGRWGISTLFSMDGFSSGRGGWSMTNPLSSTNPINFGRFSDRRMDQVLAGVNDAPSSEARNRLWGEASTIAQQQVAMVPPVYPRFTAAVGTDVKNLPIAQFGVTRLDLKNVTVQQ